MTSASVQVPCPSSKIKDLALSWASGSYEGADQFFKTYITLTGSIDCIESKIMASATCVQRGKLRHVDDDEMEPAAHWTL